LDGVSLAIHVRNVGETSESLLKYYNDRVIILIKRSGKRWRNKRIIVEVL